MIHVMVVGLYPISTETILSALDQTVEHMTWVIQDNATGHFTNGKEFEISDAFTQWFRYNRYYALRNIYQGIEWIMPQKNDIICILDGDDEFIDSRSLEWVEAAYRDPNIWITHGSYKRKSGDKNVLNCGYKKGAEFRKDNWKATHLKTFRAGLFQRIDPQDFLDPADRFLTTCSDLAIMFPMMEMAGIDRIKFIKKELYLYNDENPLNDHKVNTVLQKAEEVYLRHKQPYKRIDSL